MIYKKTWKYILTSKDTEYPSLFHLKAVKDFSDVKKGDFGGYIHGYHNLSQKGNCWVYNEARVCGCAVISEKARIEDSALITGHARISGNARVCENAIVYDYVKVSGNVIISGSARIFDNAEITENSEISGSVEIGGKLKVINKKVTKGKYWN